MGPRHQHKDTAGSVASVWANPWRVMWAASLLLLLATPFFLFARERPRYPSAFPGNSGALACIALGIVVGILIRELLRAFPLLGPFPTLVPRVALIVCTSCTFAYALFDWAAWGMWAADPTGLSWELISPQVPSLIRGLSEWLAYWPLFVCSLILMLPNPLLTPPEHTTNASESSEADRLRVGALLAALLAGILHEPSLSLGTATYPEASLQGTLAVVLVALALVSLTMRPHSGRSGTSYAGMSALFCFAFGALLWNVATRLMPTSALIPPEVAATLAPALETVCALALVVRPFVASSEDSEGTGQQAPAAALNTQTLPGYDTLSPREKECVTQLLLSSDQKEIAEELGIRPATVRVLLSRAYRKLEVSGASELLARAHGTTDERGSSTSLPPTSTAGGRRRTAALTFGVTLLLLLTLPLQLMPVIWGAGRSFLLPFGTGLATYGALRLLTKLGCPPLRMPTSGTGRWAGHGMLLLTGLATVALRAEQPAGLLSPREQIPLLLGTFVFALLLCLSAQQLTENDEEGPLGLFLIIPGAAVALSCVSRVGWLILMVVCLLGMLACLPPKDAALPVELSKNLQPVDLAPVALAFLVGFSCEEAWRSFGTLSMLWFTFPLLVVLLVGSASTLCTSRAKSIGFIAATLGLLALASSSHGAAGLAIASFALAATATIPSLVRGTAKPIATNLSLPALGCGILLGSFVINRYGDLSMYNEVALSFVGGSRGLFGLAGYLIGSLFTLAGIISIAYFAHLRNDRLAHDLHLANNEEPHTEERIAGFFSSRGLNATQASILRLILSGKSVSQISEQLNYSRGTVNSARFAGYGKLGVHSRRELLACVSAGISDVN